MTLDKTKGAGIGEGTFIAMKLDVLYLLLKLSTHVLFCEHPYFV